MRHIFLLFLLEFICCGHISGSTPNEFDLIVLCHVISHHLQDCINIFLAQLQIPCGPCATMGKTIDCCQHGTAEIVLLALCAEGVKAFHKVYSIFSDNCADDIVPQKLRLAYCQGEY